MPTYEDLRLYFQESRLLQDAARDAASVPIVCGFTLDVHPVWALLYDMESGLSLPPTLDLRWIFPYSSESLLELIMVGILPDILHWMKSRYQGYRRRDLYQRVSAWHRITEKYGEVLPVTLTIVHRPLRTPVEEGERDEQTDLSRLVTIARNSGPSVRIEERPVARLAVATGDGIQAPYSGTLGGVLDGSNGKSYGVTCAHVAQQGMQVFDRGNQLVGTCIADTPLISLAGGTACDPVLLAMPNPSPGNGPQVNMLDCALIGLSVPVMHPKIAAVAKSLTFNQDVTLTGAKTKTTYHKLGSLCLSYCFSRAGQDYCFRDLIELIPQPWGPLGGALGRALTTVPAQGDSGGWVLTGDQPPAWAGLFFGEDGTRGFAIRASWIHDWAQKTTGTQLSL